jgi:CRISPR-associated endonuclease/helicase Cas3
MEKITKEYIAHSENLNGIKQTIKEHSSGVGEFMRKFALLESFADLYEFCGFIHDIGKYSNAFQKHITGENNQVKHSIYGAIFAKEQSLMEVVFPVFGHHTGLPDNPKMRQDIKAEQNMDDGLYGEICRAWKEDIGHKLNVPNDKEFQDLTDILKQELFVRMLFSSLVDADSLDTERHFDETKIETRKNRPLNTEVLLHKLRQKFESFQNNQERSVSIITQLRDNVREFAESKSSLPQGFFSLTLPTGLGKTLCSMNWALHHAQYHKNIKRIIVVLPFISIIDQTAEVFKAIFNKEEEVDYVLEHHSNVIYAGNENKDEYNPKQLATENWDYPIIITTSVQFFESLFDNKRSACRKLHNIQDSIIIFDEIQTLPLSVTEPTLTMLDNLQQLCRCSILFCTATQPDFNTRKGFCGIDYIESLVENPQHIFEETRRVTYHAFNNYDEVNISELADTIIENQKSALVVFNTKKKARMFYDELCGNNSYRLFHLSTAMCPIHRKEVIKTIRHALENEEFIIVSSTQLIEAGVDMDFPTVYRELAPLESIIQSAGRCNREGQLMDENGSLIKGDVYLFALTESGQPSKEYRSWSEFANMLYKGNEEKLYTHDFYSYYYRELVKNFADTDKMGITADRKKLLFQTVADKYKIIENNTQALFVYNYNDESKQLYFQVKDKEYLTRQERQQIAQYCVQVYDNFVRNNNSFIGYEQCGIAVWHGSYSLDYGLPFAEEFNVLIK